MDKEFNVIKSKIYEIGRFKIICDTVLGEDEKKYPYSYVKCKDCVAVLCVVADGCLVLIYQYRHTLRSWEYEIPSGGIEEGEAPEKAAKREVLEETGYVVDTITPIGVYHLSGGTTTEIVYLYCAECHLNGDCAQKLDPLEKIKLKKVSFLEFEDMIADGIFRQCLGVTAWERYKELKHIRLW